MVPLLRAFVAANRTGCSKIAPYLPQARSNPFYQYEMVIAPLVDQGVPRVVLDIGGGKSCPFSKYRTAAALPTIIAVDISALEIRGNSDVDGKVVADVTGRLPFRANSIDLLTSRSVVEHLRDVERFAVASNEVLKAGGYFVHLLPSKFAPFALINQLLPNWLSRKLLYFLYPETKGINGFPAQYDRCYYSAIESLLRRNNFQIISLDVTYYQSPYFSFFIPLFLTSALYEIVVNALKVKTLGAYLLVVARKNCATGVGTEAGVSMVADKTS